MVIIGKNFPQEKLDLIINDKNLNNISFLYDINNKSIKKLSRCIQTLILPSFKLIGSNIILGSCKKFSIEKYLLEYDFINPFKLLMLEGAIGMFFCLLFTIHQDPFEQLNIIKKENPEYIPYLIICIFIFFLFSCGRNIYRIISNKLYSIYKK